MLSIVGTILIILIFYKVYGNHVKKLLSESKKELDNSIGCIKRYEQTIYDIDERLQEKGQYQVYDCIGTHYKNTIYGNWREYVGSLTKTTTIPLKMAIERKTDVDINTYFLYCKLVGLRDGKPILCLEDPYFQVWTEPFKKLDVDSCNSLCQRMLIIDITCKQGKVLVTRIRRTEYNLYGHYKYVQTSQESSHLDNVVEFSSL